MSFDSGGEPRSAGDAEQHWDDRGKAHGQDGRQGQAQGEEIDSTESRAILLAEAIICRSQQKVDARNEEARTARSPDLFDESAHWPVRRGHADGVSPEESC